MAQLKATNVLQEVIPYLTCCKMNETKMKKLKLFQLRNPPFFMQSKLFAKSGVIYKVKDHHYHS